MFITTGLFGKFNSSHPPTTGRPAQTNVGEDFNMRKCLGEWDQVLWLRLQEKLM